MEICLGEEIEDRGVGGDVMSLFPFLLFSILLVLRNEPISWLGRFRKKFGGFLDSVSYPKRKL